jgi:hypothetical protein
MAPQLHAGGPFCVYWSVASFTCFWVLQVTCGDDGFILVVAPVHFLFHHEWVAIKSIQTRHLPWA